MEDFAVRFKNILDNLGLGTEFTINYSKPLPPDTYGQNYPAQEFEIDWKYQGTFPVSTYANVIAKEGYYISMNGTKGKDIGDIDHFKAIFKTIKLDP